ncbi:YafY family protein [Candidatus Binatus sp.]|uniref:helix-turn-helix transcriptional regulator n=1 Tax=Candidatus Binatus sp. TaxID=2811406 RepID=UPI00272A2A77|nr:WYL domain-containing protein [Candidatus Binatus sp.]
MLLGHYDNGCHSTREVVILPESRPMKKTRRKPTYGAAVRLARIAAELYSRPYGWKFRDIEAALEISSRTLLRYVQALREGMRDSRGVPMIVVVGAGDSRALRLAATIGVPQLSSYDAAFLYFGLSVLRFLEGTVLQEGIDGLWQRVYGKLLPAQQGRLAYLDRKFYTVPYAPKDYSSYNDQLDIILRALLEQITVRIDYTGVGGKNKIHDFNPYTLIEYRGGLYVLGYSKLARKTIYFAVERMLSVEMVLEKDGQPARFPYPRTHNPASYTEGAFGIVDGPETKVELLLLNPGTETYMKSRKLHPTQQLVRRRDGKAVITMTVRGTAELENWVMSMAPYVEVLKPRELRRNLAERHLRAAKLYNN